MASIEAQIEKGMRDGESLTFPRMTDQRPGTIPGAMILSLKLAKHSQFQRSGDDLHMNTKAGRFPGSRPVSVRLRRVLWG